MFLINYFFSKSEEVNTNEVNTNEMNTNEMNMNEMKYYGWKYPKLVNEMYTDKNLYFIHHELDYLSNIKLVDLRSNCPEIYDQGKLGSCTANAIAAAFEYDAIIQNGKDNEFTPSRLYIYYNERLLEGTVQEDSGASISDSV